MATNIQLKSGESVTLRAPAATGASRELQLLAGDTVTIHAPAAVSDTPPWVDVRDQMPVNLKPDEPWLVEQGRTGWWQRTLGQIDGITLHHTMTHNLLACASYITRARAQGGKGYPTTQYAFWVQADGVIKYCVDLTQAPWHDHCGDENTHIAVGIAGEWDAESPPRVQLEATARLCAYLMRTLAIPLANVEGHREWSHRYQGKPMTTCPGWLPGGWRDAFFALLQAEVNPAGAHFSAAAAADYTTLEGVLATHDEGR